MGDWWWLICMLPLAMALGLAISESGVKKYKNKISRLKRRLKKYEKDKDMSKIINELVGKKCRLAVYGEITVLDADDEWIKFEFSYKKGTKCIKIMRVDELSEIELLG